MASPRSGPLRAWRIADGRRRVFDGAGAALHGGRWNSPGRHVIYAAETYAGAVLELMAHTEVGALPGRHLYVEIVAPADVAVEEVRAEQVPGWDRKDQLDSRAWGDRWYDEQRSAVALVPSIVTRVERNVLINQSHPHFRRIRASGPKPVIWGERLFKH